MRMSLQSSTLYSHSFSLASSFQKHLFSFLHVEEVNSFLSFPLPPFLFFSLLQLPSSLPLSFFPAVLSSLFFLNRVYWVAPVCLQFTNQTSQTRLVLNAGVEGSPLYWVLGLQLGPSYWVYVVLGMELRASGLTGLHACKASTLLADLHHQPCFLFQFYFSSFSNNLQQVSF